jgi:hypothetical protein
MSEHIPLTVRPISSADDWRMPTGHVPAWTWQLSSTPPTCAGCGCVILPLSVAGEPPTTHSKWIGTRGPFHLGCQERL